MKPELIRRNYDFECKAKEDDERGSVLYGRPIVYNSKTDIGGWWEEVIAPGALDETDLTDVRFLVNHDVKKIPLARSRRNTANSTMKLTVGDEGLDIRVDLDTENNADARSLYSAVERGDITGMSFMFSVSDQEWKDVDTDYPKRIIKKIASVVEVSAVTFPAYEDTEITARDKEALESARAALESAHRQVETGREDELELEKEKFRAIYGGNNE